MTVPPFDPPEIVIEPPPKPEITVDPPIADDIHVVPVAGPPGPQGPIGPAGEATNVQELIDTTVAAHVQAPEPHPAYDDLVDLRLWFDNGLI